MTMHIEARLSGKSWSREFSTLDDARAFAEMALPKWSAKNGETIFARWGEWQFVAEPDGVDFA